MKRKISVILAAAMLMGSVLAGCSSKPEAEAGAAVKLDPNKPVSLTIWHYYNGAQQLAFDDLVDEFNATVGKEKGIYVEGYTQGSVSDLEKAVSDAINENVGSQKLPDIFSSYADTAYAAQQADKIADISKYFTEEELSEYVDNYISEGDFYDDGSLYVFPIAKSTEIMMMNATDWTPFAEETGCSMDELTTIEGVVKVAERYYDWTDAKTPDIPDDGKAFYGRDSMANYFIIGMKQMGTEIFEVSKGEIKLNADKDKLRRLWDNYYVPYVKGYFAKYGKFCSDDVKTGEILAYTGSASSAVYFPDQVIENDNSRDINYVVLPTPIFEGGERVNVQQGAGMAVTKSDAQHEYAACEFLKWFTAKENNLRFVCEAAYLPVRKDANSMEALDKIIEDNGIEINDIAYSCLSSIIGDFDSIKFYTTKSFNNGYSARNVLSDSLLSKAVSDKDRVDEEVKNGASRAEVTAGYLTDEAFDAWYESFCAELKKVIEG